MTVRSVGIIGGGVAGLTAAYELGKRGITATIYERAEDLGGLASSVSLDGKRVDRYYHFICGADRALLDLTAELGLRDRLRWSQARTSYFVNGRMYPFSTPLDLLRFAPISLASRLRFGQHIARARRITDWQSLESLTAVDWLRREIGDEAYEVIWRPLLETKFGEKHELISAAWLWHRLWRVTQSRRTAWRPEEFGYFEGGCGTLLSALESQARNLGADVQLGSSVTAILTAGGRACGVRTEAGERTHDAIVSTVPLPALVPLLPDEADEYRQALSRIEFVGIACVLVSLRQPVQRSYWVNVNDPRIDLRGFIEFSSISPWGAPGERDFLYVPLYMPTADPRYQSDDSARIHSVCADLKLLNPAFDESWVKASVVSRSPFAQAICPTNFSRMVPDAQSPLAGLYVTDSTQLYPSDRCISGMVTLAQDVVTRLTE